MMLTDIDAILDKEFGKRETPQRKTAIQQAKKELKADFRYYARRGGKGALKDFFSLK